MGIKVGNKLRSEITSREPEHVISSIEAFKQYRDSHDVKSPVACLLSMIRAEASPNTESKPKAKKIQQKEERPRSLKSCQGNNANASSLAKQEQQRSCISDVSTPDKPAKKLMSADKLKQLSNLFSNKDE